MSDRETAREIAMAALAIRDGLQAVADSISGLYQTRDGHPSVLILALARGVDLICDHIKSSRKDQ